MNVENVMHDGRVLESVEGVVVPRTVLAVYAFIAELNGGQEDACEDDSVQQSG